MKGEKHNAVRITRVILVVVHFSLFWSFVSFAGTCTTNDYPYRDSAKDMVDVWGFYTRNCTSYVAWKMNKDAGTPSAPYYFYNTMAGPNGQSGIWGHAKDWDNNATTIGFPVSTTPQAGAIAVWEANSGGAGAYGHVAYVESTNGDGTVNITEYNWNYGDGNCNARSSVIADHYIIIHSPTPIEGCTDPNAINYNSEATVDNGSCQYPRKPTLAVFDNRLYQAVIHRNGSVATRYSFDGLYWTDWDESGAAQGSVAMLSHDDNVFQAVIQTDGEIFTRTLAGYTWEQNGVARGSVEMIAFNGRLYQSAIQADGDVYLRWRDNGVWNAWQKGGVAQGNVSFSEFNGVLYQTVVQSDGDVFHRSTQDGTNFTTWINTGSVPETGGMSISTSVHDGRFYQAVLVASTGQIYTRSSLDLTTWSAWEKYGVAQGRVAMTSYNGKLYQSVIQADGEVYTRIVDGVSPWVQGGMAEGNVAFVEFHGKLYQSVVQADEDVFFRYCSLAACYTNDDWSLWYIGKAQNERSYLLWTK
ncbi:hypothetical protein U27_06589 [Candidatus Vecturithrix granuli]|uniref:Peptidase C51 domain-containing protein n=1 Tax=Vecturithrix granuli TaxID=1499967 RepID=A0A081C4U9_VECG1|nr:hypothetical protein U27_06589 [Candidatus Vecturithrix granuli]